MNLFLHRNVFTNKSTESDLFVDARPDFVVLEDVDRGLDSSMGLDELRAKKIKNETAIPYGRYPVVMLWSNHFQQKMPHLLKVPAFDSIMIHWGNKPDDTEGCLLIGTKENHDFIEGSIVAFNAFLPQLLGAFDRGEEVWIEIRKEFPNG
jgi:hypothetical protein